MKKRGEKWTLHEGSMSIKRKDLRLLSYLLQQGQFLEQTVH